MTARPLPAGLDLLDLHRLDPARYPVLLESSATGAHGRRDLLLAHAGEGFALHRDGVVRSLAGEVLGGDFLAVLDAQWQARRGSAEAVGGRAFDGGWALLLGYELAGQVEPVLALPHAEGGLPVAVALRCPAAVLHDRESGACSAVASPGDAGWLARIEALPGFVPMPRTVIGLQTSA